MKKGFLLLAVLCVCLWICACGKSDVFVPVEEGTANQTQAETQQEMQNTEMLTPLPPETATEPVTEPVAPIDPIDPVAPEDPIEPVDPIDPVDPVDPVDPPVVEPTEKRVQFLAAGDNIIHEAVYTDAMQRAEALVSTGMYSGKYYFNSMYADVAALIAGADVAFVNHETPVAGDDFGISGYPLFNAPEQIGEALIDIGFDVVNLANNHMLDMDRKGTGLYNTISYWNAKDILQIGGYLDANDYENIRVLEVNGIKIAFLSYTTVMNGGYDVNAKQSDVVIPYADKKGMERQVAVAKEVADVVIVSMHWGSENTHKASGEQKDYASFLAKLGVHVVLGHHSHTIQPVAWVEGENGHKMLCYYSLGNFLSTQHPIRNLVGIFADFEIVMDADGNVKIENAKAIPHLTWYSTKRDGLQVKLLADVTEEDIATHGSQLRTGENGGTFTLSDVKKIVTDVLDSAFLA